MSADVPDAVEAARRILEVDECFPMTWGDLQLNAIIVAKALLSLSSRVEEARKEERERCAQVARDQTSDDPQPGDWNQACEHIADAIRSLSLPLKG